MAQDKNYSTFEELKAELWKDWEFRLWWYALYIPHKMEVLWYKIWHKT